MNHVETVNQWLTALWEAVGKDGGTLGPQGILGFRYGDALDIFIQVEEASPIVQIYAPVFSLIDTDDKSKLGVYEKCLKLNFFGRETRGAALSMDEKYNRIILNYGAMIGSLDSTAFLNLLGSFVETAQSLYQEFNYSQTSASPGPAPGLSGEFLLRV